MAVTSSELETQIELCVQLRRKSQARALIQKYRRTTREGDSLGKRCEWYRRLGLYREGLGLLNLPELQSQLGSRFNSLTPQGSRALWAARFLNLLGASRLALSVVERVESQSWEHAVVAANVYLSNFEHSKALGAFRAMTQFPHDPRSYRHRLALLGMADSLAGRREFRAAHALLKGIDVRAEEKLFAGIVLQAAGEYFAREGRYKAARLKLARAKRFYPAGDTSPDYAYWLKWSGFVEAQCGSKAKGLAQLNQAYKLLARPGLRPETWLDVLRLKDSLGQLSAVQARRAKLYPGLPTPFQNDWPAQLPFVVRGKSPALRIDLSSGEYRERSGRYAAHLPKELRLLALLVLCGDWGLSEIRAIDVLYPHESFAFSYLQSRLEQLLHRLRARGFAVSSKDRVLRLKSSDRRRVEVVVAQDQRPACLRRWKTKSADLSRAYVEKFYGVKKAHAARLLALWRERSWIEPFGRGNKSIYRVKPSGGNECDRSV